MVTKALAHSFGSAHLSTGQGSWCVPSKWRECGQQGPSRSLWLCTATLPGKESGPCPLGQEKVVRKAIANSLGSDLLFTLSCAAKERPPGRENLVSKAQVGSRDNAQLPAIGGAAETCPAGKEKVVGNSRAGFCSSAQLPTPGGAVGESSLGRENVVSKVQ